MRITILSGVVLATALTAQNPQIQNELSVGIQKNLGGGSNPAAATAVNSLFGVPCAKACGALNDMPAAQRTGTLPNEYGYAFKATSAQTVIGFSLWTNNTTAADIVEMDCAVYRENGTTAGQPAATAIATGKMGVQSSLGWYHVVLSTPVAVAANETIWISQLDTNSILASAATSGANPPSRTFWRRGAGTWSPTGIINFPVYRVLCKGATLAAAAPLKLGTTANVDMVNGTSGLPAALVLGATNPATAFACGKIYAAPTLVLSTAVGSNGTATTPIPVPNDAALDGASVYMQYWTLDASANLIGTNGIRAVVGN